MNKNIVIAIIVILILAVFGLGLWYWQYQKTEISSAPSAPAAEEAPAVGDKTGIINQELEVINVNGMDADFKEIDADLGNL